MRCQQGREPQVKKLPDSLASVYRAGGKLSRTGGAADQLMSTPRCGAEQMLLKPELVVDLPDIKAGRLAWTRYIPAAWFELCTTKRDSRPQRLQSWPANHQL